MSPICQKLSFASPSKIRLFGDTLFEPCFFCFVVSRYESEFRSRALEDGDVEFVFVDCEPVIRSDEFPSVGNRILLEIVAERKIAQHLEKRVVTIGEADVFEIVMFAAGTHAFLRGCGALVVAGFEAEEDVLELVHARVGEEQRGIVGRNERGGMDLFVSVLDEIVQEFAANLGASQHEKSILN